ncbi:hypothetical protein RND71_020358 [Anisodus tanguticus]|uniref:Phospholipid-transporting ATPase n=1 Tax=Anisodus tanguticus TaxID=243964 RepID=A0AAE1VFA0_9SOLA|nr:hypothetical protein RND71_020358 [Anisodus tanguticus]
MLKQQRGGRKKQKVKWSQLYTFSCLHPQTNESDPTSFVAAPSAQSFIGQPGYSRVVFCNEPHCHNLKPYKYPNNYVSTTKYNIVTFFPIALFEQFRRVANLYFLLAAVLSVTSLAPFTPVSVISPLVFVVGISMLKEAMEDWNRFLQDLKVNARKVKVHIGNGEFVERAWREVYVGDVIKVNKNEYFPGDLLLLSSSYEDGLCYVETMNLDGETNLKVKRSLEATLSLDGDEQFSNFLATVRCEDPNPNLYTFVGNLEFENESHPLSPNQILLRDSKLRNTDYVYGVVVFSGPDTKAVRNSTRSPSKRSRIERKMDHVIYVLFAMLILISMVSSIGSTIFTKTEAVKWYYLELKRSADSSFDPSKPVVSCLLQFIRDLVLYGYLIPISLYVSIEVVKVLQAMLINKDQNMYDDVTDKSVEARTSNLNEELGQVEMILTDKTGTLTCNQMEFRKCSIEGISYGGEITEIDLAASRRMNIEVERYRFSLGGYDPSGRSLEMFEFSMADQAAEKMVLGLEQGTETPNTTTPRNSITRRDSIIKGFNFRDDRLMDKMWINRSNVSDMMMFFRVMALCHTGIPIEDEKSEKLKYEAESPEEVSFLIAAQEFGFKFCSRTQSMMVVEELDPSSGMDVKREYKLLNLLEFNSSRKRMSVIVRNENGDIFLLCKGADNVILARLADNGRTFQQATTVHLSNYAEDGLRTMLFAYKKIKTDEYEKWNSLFRKAKATIGPEREDLLENASEMIEKDLLLLGAVAIEDKLQKGVPECIDKLAQAGLKIWLLTGDKKETAVNIGYACSLLRQDMKQVHLTLSKEAESKNLMKVMREDILGQIERYSQMVIQEDTKDRTFALIVDGKALEIALSNDIKDQLLRLAVRCDSVICCRVSPKQKALITRLVKQHTGKTTLAIGDGANDVGMIQEADIGVGISGMEGMQAVMASDFSMPQFRFLERLLIVHGHWCYKRISKLILYFVYKNVTFGLTLFFYDILTTSSGQVLFDDWYIVIFNVLLTSLPVISLGVLEQDVSSEVCLKFPTLYQQGPKNICFSWKRIIGWILNASFTSLAIFAINISALSPAAFTQGGEVADLGHIEAIGPAAMFWIVTLLAVVTSLLPYFIHIAIQRSFFPMDDHLIQEMEHFRMDIVDGPMWLKEQQKSKEKTKIGFSARVDAKIRQLKEQLQRKKKTNI